MEDEEATQPSSQPQGSSGGSKGSGNDPQVACTLLVTKGRLENAELRRHGNGAQKWMFGRNAGSDVVLGTSKRYSNHHFMIWTVSSRYRVVAIEQNL